jgi:hypothetical protein
MVLLRDIVETYPRRGRESYPLFIRCERVRGRESQIGFAISPTDLREAQEALDGLLAYCRYHVGETCLQWFSVTEQQLRERDVWDPKLQAVPRDERKDERHEVEEGIERWELLEESDSEEETTDGINRTVLDHVPNPQSAENRAIHGRDGDDSFILLNAKRKDGANGKRKQRVSRKDLKSSDGASCGGSTRAKVDRMLAEAMEVCVDLSIPYDEESLCTAQSTRERCALLEVMHNGIRQEKARIRRLKPKWSDRNLQQSPGEEASEDDARSVLTEQTGNGTRDVPVAANQTVTVTPGQDSGKKQFKEGQCNNEEKMNNDDEDDKENMNNDDDDDKKFDNPRRSEEEPPTSQDEHPASYKGGTSEKIGQDSRPGATDAADCKVGGEGP